MNNELELWQFIAERLRRDQEVMLLLVAESSGSSPGRQGYKMAVGSDGKLCGSIGGGVMEVRLVELAKGKIEKVKGKSKSEVVDQVHRKGVADSSGMICSGKQTVIFKLLTQDDTETIETFIISLKDRASDVLVLTRNSMKFESHNRGNADNFHFDKCSGTDFTYTEKLGFKNDLYIIGGGHCALALSELMSKMDFHISIFDDRPELNTIEKNQFAHEIKIIESYEDVGNAITTGDSIYVVVMTLGYMSDAVVIRQLLDKDFRYFGVLGSNAKMKTLMKELKAEGYDEQKLERIRTPIGLPINSRSPEEIAVSIAAEIISVKNA